MLRRSDIDQAKGLAILLVVFGHIVARADPANVDWYEPLRRAVYAFHMPFFLYLSGTVTMLSGTAMLEPKAWPAMMMSRAKRLLLAFLALGLLSIFGKLAAQHFIFVDHAPDGLLSGIVSLLWYTSDSPNGSVWYLWVLFVFSVVTPVLVYTGGLPVLMLVAVLLYFLPLPCYVYADHLSRYAIFFAAGVAAAAAGEVWTGFIDRHWRWLLILMVTALALDAVAGRGWPVAESLLPIGLISMPALHGLVRHSTPCCRQMFQWLGRYCFMIYLFNTMSIGLAKGILLRFTNWDGPHFLPFAIALMVAGILLPVALKEVALQRFKQLDAATN